MIQLPKIGSWEQVSRLQIHTKIKNRTYVFVLCPSNVSSQTRGPNFFGIFFFLVLPSVTSNVSSQIRGKTLLDYWRNRGLNFWSLDHIWMLPTFSYGQQNYLMNFVQNSFLLPNLKEIKGRERFIEVSVQICTFV